MHNTYFIENIYNFAKTSEDFNTNNLDYNTKKNPSTKFKNAMLIYKFLLWRRQKKVDKCIHFILCAIQIQGPFKIIRTFFYAEKTQTY